MRLTLPRPAGDTRHPMAARTPVLAAVAAALAAGLTAPGLAGAGGRGPAAAGAGPGLAEMASAARTYAELAGFHLRAELDADTRAALRRAVEVAAALATARPGAAIEAALSGERPVLTARPVDGELSSPYGVRRDPFRKRRLKRHNGVDLVAERGTPVHAAGAGRVVRARRMGGYGRVVYLDHGDGLQTRYAHLQSIDVEEGAFVPAGARVGRVGSTGRATGPHLHFEVRVNGAAVAPVKVMGLLGMGGEAGDGAAQVTAEPAAAKATKARTKKAASKPKRTRTAREPRSKRPSS